MLVEIQNGDYTINTDKKKLKPVVIHTFLKNSYWSPGITFDYVKKAIKNSECFGLYFKGEQVGFARVITDYTSLGYLADVFILEKHRGKGLAKWMLESIFKHPDLQNIRKWMLATKDAHTLYERYGFQSVENPAKYMIKPNAEFVFGKG